METGVGAVGAVVGSGVGDDVGIDVGAAVGIIGAMCARPDAARCARQATIALASYAASAACGSKKSKKRIFSM